MRESQFKRFFGLAVRRQGAGAGEVLLELLERRLDNVVYRLKMASTRSQARQMVVHAHIRVNGKKVGSPSYLVCPSDVISLSSRTIERATLVKDVVDKRMGIGIKVPTWLELKKEDRTGVVLRMPERSEVSSDIEEHLIVELYSK
jgi:small subunit ribosomal protein S4